MIKYLFYLSVVLFIQSCTQPKYYNSQNQLQGPMSGKESISSCELQFEKSKLCLIWSWEKKPTSTEYGEIVYKTFRLNEYDQTPIEIDLPFTPEIYLWMPSMGHGSIPTQTARIDVGTYRATDVFFIMPGEWNIQFLVKNGEDLIEKIEARIIID